MVENEPPTFEKPQIVISRGYWRDCAFIWTSNYWLNHWKASREHVYTRKFTRRVQSFKIKYVSLVHENNLAVVCLRQPKDRLNEYSMGKNVALSKRARNERKIIVGYSNDAWYKWSINDDHSDLFYFRLQEILNTMIIPL